MAFAAKHAEGVYTGGLYPSGSKESIAATRAAAAANGREPASLLAMIGLCPILGRTVEEAQAKYEDYCKYADATAGLAQFAGYSGIDLTDYPLDDEFNIDNVEMDSGNAIHTIIRALGEGDPNGRPWTPRLIGLKQAMGGFHPLVVGTPAMVADHMQEWIDVADADGTKSPFSTSYHTEPHGSSGPNAAAKKNNA
jgi:alkanesulfonate monooxygenase SsuD/methylene tetrahydromethanopterin reductase-like flavin-dependent oxidoreductase (luciferase family)